MMETPDVTGAVRAAYLISFEWLLNGLRMVCLSVHVESCTVSLACYPGTAKNFRISSIQSTFGF